MHQLAFGHYYRYSSQAEGIRLPVTLKNGSNDVETFAFVDTGAANCVFQREFGDLLGLDVATGDPQTFVTVCGRVSAFGHTVVLEVLDLTLECTVFFFSDEHIQKNILGRNGWLK